MAASVFDSAQLIALGRVGKIAVAPAGDWVAVAVQRLDADGAKYVSDLWRVPLDGGAAIQLTRGEHNDSAPCFRADGALGFLSNRGSAQPATDDDAKDRNQVWVLPAAAGEPYQVTDEPLGVDAFQFAACGDRLLCVAPVLPDRPHDKQREIIRDRRKNGPSALRFTRQPVRHWDHWLADGIATPVPHLIAYVQDGTGRRDLTPAAVREHLIEPEFAVSRDGNRAVVTSARVGADRIDDVALALIDLDTGTARILAEGPRTRFQHPVFSPDCKRIACIATRRSEERVGKPALTLIDVATGAAKVIAHDWDRWPVPGDWTPDGRTLIVSADDDGCTPVFGIDAATGAVTRLTAPSSGGTHGDLHVTVDGVIVGVRSTLRSPPEVFAMPANAGQVLPEPQAPSLLAALSRFAHADSVVMEDARVRSTDGAMIQSWIVKPARSTGRLPVLFAIHGGPIGAFGDGWHWRWNALLWASAGYMVVLPNARGSTGFGQEFIQGIWRNQWGAQCYRDLMAVADAIAARPDVDPGRIAALGGSFGGYMTNWIGGNTDRFRALATHACVFSMSAFTGVTDHPAYWLLEMGGDPYQDVQAFDRYSPARFVQNWKSPTLIIHGERDYRCPIGEGLALFEALQHFGIESEIVIFPDENHWILKPRNIVAWNTAVLEFMGRHLG
jgi:dipeptidyl aminopeptidase/acylaminoacyl peptidase